MQQEKNKGACLVTSRITVDEKKGSYWLVAVFISIAAGLTYCSMMLDRITGLPAMQAGPRR